MSRDHPSSPDGNRSSVASLDSAVPAQEQAKSVLRTEFAVFKAQRSADSLAAQPVLLCGNHPGCIPARLVRALAEEAGLPWVEVSVGPGFCVEQVVSQLARLTPQCREDYPLGVALLSELQNVSAETAQVLAAHLTAADRSPHLHQGRLLSLSPHQVFWVGAMQVREPSREAGRSEGLESGRPFALLAVGPSSAEVVAAGVTGQVRAAGSEAEQTARLEALVKTFKANALLLPGTMEDLVAWASAEAASWWPGRRLRLYCEQHGVEFVMGQGAAGALAEEAARRGGTVDAMEDRLRQAMDPVIAAIADTAHQYSAVEMTPAALSLTEAPRLIGGPRRPRRAGTEALSAAEFTDSGIERPPRTPLSSPEVRLARAEDLRSILSPDSTPTAR